MQSTVRAESASGKSLFYQQVCEQLDLLLGEEANFVTNCANTSAFLFQMLPDVNWVGFYLKDGESDELVLGPFQGKPACARIPFGKGVCGTAASEGETVVVPNVADFPGHIACDASSQSEIVVPLMNWGEVMGVLDVDSSSLDRFDEDDREGLESVVAVLLAAQQTTGAPSFDDEDSVE